MTDTTHHSYQSTAPLQDGRDATRELTEKSSIGEDDDVGELLAELCNDTLTPAERLENQFALANTWALDDGKLETRILRVLKHDPRTTQTGSVPDDDLEDTDLSETEQSVLTHLPATEDELTDSLDIAPPTLRSLISSVRDKGLQVGHDGETHTYVYHGTDGETESGEDESGNTDGQERTTNTEAQSDAESESDESIYLVYWLPSEEVAVEEFEKPIPWNTEKYKFARLVEAIGYGPSTLDQLEGEPVILESSGSDWQVPDPADEDVVPSHATDAVAPPGSSTSATVYHLRKAVTGIFYDKLVNRYTVGAAAFIGGAVAAYALYLIGATVIPPTVSFILSIPEMLSEALVPEPSELAEDDGSVNAEAMEDMMYNMFHLVFLMTILVTVAQLMKKMMTPPGRR